jgi:hypothetical protein
MQTSPLHSGHAPESNRIPPWQVVKGEPSEVPSRIATLSTEQMQAVVALWKSRWKSKQRKEVA